VRTPLGVHYSEVFMTNKNLYPTSDKTLSPVGVRDVDRIGEDFDDLLKQQPPNIAALREAGAVCSYKGDFGRATDFYKKILEVSADDHYALNELGVIYSRQGKFPEAIELLNKALTEHPDNVYVLSELGLIHSTQGDPEKAALCLERIVKATRASFAESFEHKTDQARTAVKGRKKDQRFIASGRITTANAIATCFAHQINNPLQIIQNSIDNLEDIVEPGGSSIEGDLQKIRNSADRIHELIQHLYRLIKNESKDNEFLLIREVLFSAYALFEKQLQNRGITVEIGDIADPQHTPVVYGNGVELEQVFINLFANARDALAVADDPKIIINAVMSGEREVTIYFSDNGVGISEENLERVFDSLFTTKPDGTGLGLWLCLSVINQMGGTIKVESALGRGTTFAIRLPTR
jgi:signal transduction histidine kinase